MGFSFGNMLSAFRSPNTMGGDKPYIDESGAIGRKRFTTGTTPSWEEQFKPHQAQAGPNPWEQRDDDKDEANSYYDELERIRSNRGPALSAYQKALGEQPTYEQHKPGKGRRIAAGITGALAGLGGDIGAAVGTARYIKDSPYHRAQEEYGERMKNLGASAKLEQDEVEAQLQSLKEARALGLKYDEYRLKQLENEQTRRYQQGQLDVANRGADTASRVADTGAYTANTGRQAMENTAWYQQQQANTAENAQYANERNIDSQIENRGTVNSIARDRLANDLKIAQIRAGANPATPAEQQTAIDGALRELMSHGRYRGYIKQNGNFLDPHPDDGSDEYKMFWNELTRLTNRRLQTGLPLGPQMEDPEPDVEIMPER